MPSYKETLAFAKPLKGLRIVPPGPPPPPMIPEPEVLRREAQAAQLAQQKATAAMQQRLDAQKQESEQTCKRLLAQFQQQHQQMVAEVAARLPALVLALTRRILVNIETSEPMIRAIVEDALGEMTDLSGKLEVRLSAKDYALFESFQADFASAYPALTFEKDASLKAGDCVLKSRFGIVDARLETKMQRLEEELSQS